LPSDVRWLPVEEVIALNMDLVAETGEPFGLLDKGALEGACGRPQQHWAYGDGDILTAAVALMFGIARNHPFMQGNKRTGMIALVMLLEMNGYILDAELDDEGLGDIVLAVLDHHMSEEEFADHLRPSIIAMATA
jgi:death-on-curing protein